MPAITGMKGAGFYDLHSGPQMSTIRALQSWIDDAVSSLPLPASSQPVTILDLGSSEGGNAIRQMAAIVAGLRRRTGQPLQTVYSDLASNNFNQLFANLHAARRTGALHEQVYPSAVGGSFYEPLLVPGTVHFAVSFNSVQWLDRLPDVLLPSMIAYRRPSPLRPNLVVSPEVMEAFTRQAEQDLVRFLERRALELVPGGKLLLAAPGDSNEASVCDGLADVLNDACLDLVITGQLKQAEYERIRMPCYWRNVEEMLAPLERQGSPVRGAFTVERSEALEVPPPFIVEFRRSGDAATYAGAYSGFIRAVTEPVVRGALNRPNESTTVEGLYERVRARLLAEPERYVFRYILVAVLLTRR